VRLIDSLRNQIIKYLIKTGQVFYSLALIVYGVQQFYFSSFRNVFFSAYEKYLPFLNVLAWLFGLYLIVSALFILTGKKVFKVSAILGFVFLALFFITQIPYQVFSEPYSNYLALWVNPLKEFALAGGAFVVAGSMPAQAVNSKFLKGLHQLTPYGNLFFLFTMTCFGILHLSLGPRLEYIVPSWWPHPLFWIYFTGAALIGAGVSIMLGIRIRVVALFLALMIFLWFWMVHIPAGIKRPVFDRGNLLASAFDALAFSGIALLIAATVKQQKWIADIEKWK
jgi:uncharacterized membrane protein YphA (DoxX/SURF4 family)